MSGDTDSQDPSTNSDGPGAPLPPPAFPPGKRRGQVRRDFAEAQEDLGEAFISPDEPIPERPNPDEAFISPDEPIPHRDPVAVKVSQEGLDPDEVMVTGIGDDAHMEPEEISSGGDPHVMELTKAVSKLSEALKRRGEAGLRSSPDMSRFEATLRAYCVGFLAGRRAEEEDAPDY